VSAQYKYGRQSKSVLITLHPKLREVTQSALLLWDHSLLRGVRDVEQQKIYVHQGLSQTMDSRHLPGGGYQPDFPPEFTELSYAVDMAPFIGGKVSYDKRHVAFFAGCVLTIARDMNVDLRWGGDWDGDGNQVEHSFWDGVHFELKRGIYQ